MSKNMHLVIGQCGAYSDHQWWVAGVFSSEEKADAWAAEMNAELISRGMHSDQNGYPYQHGEEVGAEAEVRALDPDACFDACYGMDYATSFAPLDPSSHLLTERAGT